MIAYWILFFIPACRALVKPRHSWGRNTIISLWIALCLFIGLRYEVGGDWRLYMVYMQKWVEIDWGRDPLYEVIVWLSLKTGLGIVGMNLACAAIFTTGLIWFCKNTPRPWLALTIAIPYFVIVVSIGYTRQAAAIGFLMFGFSALCEAKVLKFLVFCILAGSFQQTSLIALPLAIPYVTVSRRFADNLIKLLILIISFVPLVKLLLYSQIDNYVRGYIEADLQSGGATIRAALNIIPASIFLMWGKRLNLNDSTNRVWRWISIYCFICGVGLIIMPNSTAIDRLGLYAVPIQLFVASRIPDFKLFSFRPYFLTFLVVLFAFIMQFTWLFYGSFTWAWIPYRNLLWYTGPRAFI